MPDPRIANLAKVIVDYSVKVRPGDRCYTTTTAAATPLVQELYKRILECGGSLFNFVELPGLAPLLFDLGNDEQITQPPTFLKQAIESWDVRLAILSAQNTRELSGVDPAKQAKRAAALRPMQQTFMDRSATKELRWNVTLFPTDAYAQDADMSLLDFEDFVYAACLADQPDPVAAWQVVERKQQVLVDYLEGKSEVHLVGPETDLTVGIAGRSFVNCCGEHNMPDGEIFTGPEETRVNGHVRFSFPAIMQGREVSDVRLWFENGVVVKATAGKNEEFMLRMLDTDEGARRLGEFAFGTNFGIRRFIKNILFDEKIGGTIHMALGGGYPETGSLNRSAIHWDMICDLRQGAEVRVDGEPFARDGKYLPWPDEA